MNVSICISDPGPPHSPQSRRAALPHAGFVGTEWEASLWCRSRPPVGPVPPRGNETSTSPSGGGGGRAGSSSMAGSPSHRFRSHALKHPHTCAHARTRARAHAHTHTTLHTNNSFERIHHWASLLHRLPKLVLVCCPRSPYPPIPLFHPSTLSGRHWQIESDGRIGRQKCLNKWKKIDVVAMIFLMCRKAFKAR